MSKRERSKSSCRPPLVLSAGGPSASKRAAGERAKQTPQRGELAELPPPGLPQRFHVAAVAESFGVVPRTVRSWIEKGLLEREKVGNSVFIRADQIEAMLNGPKKKKKP